MTGLVALLLLSQLSDDPYVRSRSATVTDAGLQACLHWSAGTVTMHQNALGSVKTPGDTEFAAVSRAIGHWEAQFELCGDLTIQEGDHTQTDRIGFDASSNDNENIIVFREQSCMDLVDPADPCWADSTCGNTYSCWDHSAGTIALTTTSYDPGTGRLFDADIEGNAAGFLFTTVDSPPCPPGALATDCVAFDVENTFTHEMGHVVGLAHTNHPGSTMNPSAPAGETSKRTIDPGSLSFVCDAYPKGSPATDCLPPPASIDGSSFNCTQVSAAPSALAGLCIVTWWLRRRRT